MNTVPIEGCEGSLSAQTLEISTMSQEIAEEWRFDNSRCLMQVRATRPRPWDVAVGEATVAYVDHWELDGKSSDRTW